MVTRVPTPRSLVIAIWPPNNAASRRLIARPRPLPPERAVVDASAWVKGEQPGHVVRGDTDPVSATTIRND
jgi:hypothetical protein